MAGDRHGKHNTTTISFRVNSYEKVTIEERVKVSGMKKQDYIVRSCIYNHVCVVGKKETIEIIRSEMKEMSLVLEDVAKDLKSEKPVISEPALDSMTDLDRIEEVELNIVDRRWQSALALALTLPDICGGIAFPEIVKHYRDGRVMLDRQKNPTRDVGTQYIRWFDEYARDYFKLSQSDEKPYICGERCWQLRCEYLHQNKGFLNDENNIRFHLGLNCGMSVCQLESMNIQENGNDIRIDIEQFCLRMCKAAKSYYDKVHLEKDFSLYNTPVLDFIQVTQKKKAASIIALVCGSERYAKGLKETLQFISDQIMLFYTPESAKTRLGRHKPDLWIVTEDMTSQPNQPWRADRTTPVILITGNPDAVEIKKNSGKLTVLSMPLSIVDLRKTVEIYVS